MIENNYENRGERPQKSKGEARFSLMKGLMEDVKSTYVEINNKREEGGLNEESKQRAKRMAVLSLLIAAEAIPVVETANEGAKVLSKSEKILGKIKDKSPSAVKIAKSKGLIGDLYPNVPDWFVSSMAVLDTFGVPGIGVAPDAFQLIHDRAMTMKDQVGFLGETVSTFKQIRDQRKALISQAVSTFNN